MTENWIRTMDDDDEDLWGEKLKENKDQEEDKDREEDDDGLLEEEFEDEDW